MPGIDVVRALAVIGMIYVHVVPASWLPGGTAESRPMAPSLLDDALRSRSMSLFVLLAGVSFAVGRLDLHSRAVRLRMLVTGVLVAAVSWTVSSVAMVAGVSAVLDRFDAGARATLEAGGHLVFPWESLLAMPPRMTFSLSVPTLVLTAGVGIALIGGVVTLMERPVWRRALWPLAATGSHALTWYAGHLLALRAIDDSPYSFLLFAVFVGFAMVFSVVWRHWIQRGPLEWLVHRVVVLAVPGRGTSCREVS
ncbi:DUF418 domain-containing protein [Thermocatellispora tengchongensis]|uniref:DUF418 domain-containing protein n=1 Tax=Thermocatellispora tengchongensis TaxID=1073253 RepID=UPI00161118C9